MRRVEISGSSFTCLVSSPTMVKESASSGQSSMQFMQEKHSLTRTAACGSAAPSQRARHMLQSVHLCTSRLMRTRENRENTPSSAPNGQSNRQKKRGTKTLAPTSTSMNRPIQNDPTKIRLGTPGANLRLSIHSGFVPGSESTVMSKMGATTVAVVRYIRQIGSSSPI